jgi:hypothetical protein
MQIETNADIKDIKRAIKDGNLKDLEVKKLEPPSPPIYKKSTTLK